MELTLNTKTGSLRRLISYTLVAIALVAFNQYLQSLKPSVKGHVEQLPLKSEVRATQNVATK